MSNIIDKRPFAINLRQERELKGWSQEQAARNIGIPFKNYQAYEEDRCQCRLDTLRKICYTFRINDVLSFISEVQKN